MDNQYMSLSTAARPDLDWSQIRETVRMLHLAVAQIDMTLREGDDSVKTLGNSFSSMAESINLLIKGYERIAFEQADHNITDSIKSESNSISSQIQQSVVAFQFYDKLSQRLAHVSHALAALADLVNDQGRLYNPQEMFDHLLAGGTIDEALQKGRKVLHQISENDEIELF
jgi:hypothetical protein